MKVPFHWETVVDSPSVPPARFPWDPPLEELFSRPCRLELRHVFLTERRGRALSRISLPTTASEDEWHFLYVLDEEGNLRKLKKLRSHG